MLTPEEHIDSLIRHINLVRDNCTVLGKKLIKQGRVEFGRLLIARGFAHDNSKFFGVEWNFLHLGKGIAKTKVELAARHHAETNSHHPEYHGGFDHMPDLDLSELACDWAARAMEFGTDLREWIDTEGMKRYNFTNKDENYKLLMKYVELLLEDSFVRSE